MLPHQLAITERGAPFLPGFVRGGDFNSVDVGTAIQLMGGQGSCGDSRPRLSGGAKLRCNARHTPPRIFALISNKKRARLTVLLKKSNAD